MRDWVWGRLDGVSGLMSADDGPTSALDVSSALPRRRSPADVCGCAAALSVRGSDIARCSASLRSTGSVPHLSLSRLRGICGACAEACLCGDCAVRLRRLVTRVRRDRTRVSGLVCPVVTLSCAPGPPRDGGNICHTVLRATWPVWSRRWDQCVGLRWSE